MCSQFRGSKLHESMIVSMDRPSEVGTSEVRDELAVGENLLDIVTDALPRSEDDGIQSVGMDSPSQLEDDGKPMNYLKRQNVLRMVSQENSEGVPSNAFFRSSRSS